MPPPRLVHLRRLLLLPLRSSHPPHGPAPTPGRPLLNPVLPRLLPRAMAGVVAHAGVAAGSTEYEEVLGSLASLITQKVRADTGNYVDKWELMPKYLRY